MQLLEAHGQSRSISRKCFFVMLGDDVKILDIDWIPTVMRDFERLHKELKLPADLFGFGCIALSDVQAPGFPTFPILHKVHIQLLGELFSPRFVNQDADPFLSQLYRRWSVARFSSAKVVNTRGGVQLLENKTYTLPRYERVHIVWKHEILDAAVNRVSRFLRPSPPPHPSSAGLRWTASSPPSAPTSPSWTASAASPPPAGPTSPSSSSSNRRRQPRRRRRRLPRPRAPRRRPRPRQPAQPRRRRRPQRRLRRVRGYYCYY
jgi:hypothetical protein